MNLSKEYPNHCSDCGVRKEKCNCGGEGKLGEAKIKAEQEKLRKAGKK